MLFDFGQPTTSIIQIAFVVPDIDEAMEQYTKALGIGPWTVLRDFGGPEAQYKGAPTKSKAHLALGFSGHMQYELIQPADDLPSVHKDTIDSTGYGFHHFGYATADFDADVARMVARGYDVEFSDSVGVGGRVAYFDTRDHLPGMIEYMESGATLNKMFTPMFLASAAERRELQA